MISIAYSPVPMSILSLQSLRKMVGLGNGPFRCSAWGENSKLERTFTSYITGRKSHPETTHSRTKRYTFRGASSHGRSSTGGNALSSVSSTHASLLVSG